MTLAGDPAAQIAVWSDVSIKSRAPKVRDVIGANIADAATGYPISY